MEHYQVKKLCGVCQRKLIADISSVGSPHQTLMAITCEECAVLANGNIMKEGEIEKVEVKMGDIQI
jgi:hypothetical protein